MERHKPNRIHIIGSVGSGKTTLARTLSSMLAIPFYELDNVVWIRDPSGDIRRTTEERDEVLQTIIKSDTWIIEGAHHTWILPSLQRAELIIFLDTDYSKRTYRIIKRFILQKMGLEKANYTPSFEIFKKMFAWNAQFENESKPLILNMLNPFNDNLIILKNNTEINKYIKER